MKRKIFEQTTVNVETGEIIETVSEYVSKNIETFFMGRTTQGIEWLLQFNNLTELQLLIIMLELENPKNGYIISFTTLQVKESAEILTVSQAQIKKCLTSLIKNGFLKRVERSNYIANPLTFYKGGTKLLKEKIKLFNSYE